LEVFNTGIRSQDWMRIEQCIILSLLFIETQPLVKRAVVAANVCGVISYDYITIALTRERRLMSLALHQRGSVSLLHTRRAADLSYGCEERFPSPHVADHSIEGSLLHERHI